SNTASSIYYVLPGVHGAHVVAGLTALVYLMVKALKASSTTQAAGAVEIFGIYWGMVDAVWVFLFPLLYLLCGVALIDETKYGAVYGILMLGLSGELVIAD